MSARRAAPAGQAPRTTSLRRRASKVRHDDLARPVKAGASFAAWLDALPGVLAADDLRALAAAIATRAAASARCSSASAPTSSSAGSRPGSSRSWGRG